MYTKVVDSQIERRVKQREGTIVMVWAAMRTGVIGEMAVGGMVLASQSLRG
jgi:hypothetical protein